MKETTRLGPFAVEQRIGEGGMGAVYRGTHRETGVLVAIKVIHREAGGGARDRFHEEVQAHAGLQHPGIVYLFEYGEVDEAAAGDGAGLEAGSPFVAMELADRGTVRDWMPVGDWKTVCRLLVQILDALAYAHARGVVHRDLKPENFLVFEAGETKDDWWVKLADFGIAHAFDREQEAETAELSVAAGTPLYMAPEQLHGQWREFGPWTDLYALGCVAYELVCGRPPFEGESAFGTAKKHATALRPPLEPRFPVPDELEAWIHRAMAAEPERRFRRAADAAWALPRGVLYARGEEAGGPDQQPEPADGTLERTHMETLAETLVLEETGGTIPADTVAEEASPLEEAPTRAPAGGHGEFSQVETVAADSTDASSMSGNRKNRTGDLLERLHPPVPEDWRPEHTDPIPAPLVGAGLGLFGLREPPFVDRREACDRIWRELHRVVEQGGCESVFVAGEAGTGKSRLAEWITTRAHEVGAAEVVRVVHTPEAGAGEGLRGALDRTLRTVKMGRSDVHAHLEELLASLTIDEDELAGDDARALTEYLRPTDEGADQVDGPRFRFASAGQKRSLLVRTLGRLAGRRPLILWLDDLQWGAEALGVLEALVEDRSEAPAIMVLATVRSDVVAEHPRLAERLEALQRGDGAERLMLEPLSRVHQRELLTGLLPLEDDLADRLADRTEGHPLFAMQLLGHWIDGGALEVGSRGFRLADGETLELPEDIHQLWMRRIDRLIERFGEEADQVLEALELAAALGRQVDAGQWDALLVDADIDRPDRLVDRLVERGLAERTPDGWAFAHGLLVDSLARRARGSDRWEDHHRRCAWMLEARLTGEEPGPREAIAEHWVAGGRPERALEPLRNEARLCMRRGKVRKHRSLLERLGELLDRLEVADDDPLRLEQRIRWADMMDRRDHLERARSQLIDIWEQLGDDQSRLQALCAHSLAINHTYTNERRQARLWVKRALEAARRAGNPQMRGRSHNRLAWNWFREGEHERARRHIDQAIEWAERAGDYWAKLDGLRSHIVIQEALGDESDGELLERLREETAEVGYVALEAQMVNDLGERARFEGRLEEARRHYRRYLETARQLSRPIRQANAHQNLGQIALRIGDLEEMRGHLEAANDILESVGAANFDVVHLLRLGDAAATGDREAFGERWARFESGWPEDWRLIEDHPWLLETIGEYAEEVGWQESAREVWELAAELWEELGDEEAAAEVRRRVEA